MFMCIDREYICIYKIFTYLGMEKGISSVARVRSAESERMSRFLAPPPVVLGHHKGSKKVAAVVVFVLYINRLMCAIHQSNVTPKNNRTEK